MAAECPTARPSDELAIAEHDVAVIVRDQELHVAVVHELGMLELPVSAGTGDPVVIAAWRE